MDIGDALKYYRRNARMTQAKVAEQAGVNEKYYGQIERGESSPTIDRLELICFSLGISIQQLVGYVPLKDIVVESQQPKSGINKVAHAYCNCCGTEFSINNEMIICPQCGCEYSEYNEYIEVYEN
ncbi:MAG: helix-turn-helix domain-containing protein [Blautia sp.]|nr:helix-turn-helix domain-containing protein [Blautia sp.]